MADPSADGAWPVDTLPEHWRLPSGRVLLTGANGHLGQRLVRALGKRMLVRALVRSERAKAQVEQAAADTPVEIRVGRYDDPSVLADALTDCEYAVHLVGIIKESRSNSFHQAHVATTAALVQAATAQGLKRLVYLSIVGADRDHANPALASKATAESLLLEAPVPATIFRVPMVLGEGDYASAALAARGRSKRALTLRAASLEQPIYAGDVVRAVVQSLLDSRTENRLLELPGPEQLSRAALIERAGAVLNNHPAVTSLPVSLGLLAAGLLEKVSANPPITRAMLGVLDHDDTADGGAAAAYLDFSLVPLNEMLQRCLTA
ncbi:MAG: SDR family oxidoreductase [Pseudomonadales bacterium]